jgi:hypothetical protein
MSDSIEKEQSTISSHQLHNMGCFAYLQQIKLPPIIFEQMASLPGHARLKRLAAKQEEYDPKYAYADLFTALCKFNEETILPFIEKQKIAYDIDVITKKEHRLLAENEQRMHDLNNYVISFFLNDNKHLKTNYDYLKSTVDSLSPTSLSAEKAIKQLLHDKDRNANVETLSPEQIGSDHVLFATMISSNFKPQHGTSLKSIIDNKEGEPILLRLGTIAQRHEGKPRIDPLVDSYFEAQAYESPGKITHVTFNLLGRDREGFEGGKEKELTEVIEEAEGKHPNVIMITLPADKGLMDGDQYKNTKANLSYQDTIDELLLIATEDPNAQTKIKDFHISDKARRLVFANDNGDYSKEIERVALQGLFEKSATQLTINTKEPISAAQQQALWFHFIKFELTDHILVKLDPVSYNIDCKDGIDRGAAHRAYYRLIKNIEAGTPMTRDAFQEALHAAAAGNKGRGMNHHHNMIWNAVDAYVSANYDSIKTNEKQSWMLEWRDWNCPAARVDSVMKQRIGELIEDLKLKEVESPGEDIKEAVNLLEQIKLIPGTSGKAILFEAALRIHALVLKPNDVDAKRCVHFAETVGVEFPTIAVLFGQIEKFAKEVLIKLSVGEAMTDYLTAKIEGVKTEEHVTARNAVQEDMKQFLKSFRTEKPQNDNTKEVAQENEKRMSI